MVLLLAACDPGDGVPDISDVDKSALVLAVLARDSFEHWDRVWVDSGVFTAEDRSAISAAIGTPVQFVADDREAWGDVGVLPEGEILLGFTKPSVIKRGVIGMDMWVSFGVAVGSGSTWLFQWNGQSWILVEPEQVDVTVTTAVS